MEATATSGMGATPANANTDTGGSTVKKVALLIEKNELTHWNNNIVPLSKPPSDFAALLHRAQTQLLMHQETCHYS